MPGPPYSRLMLGLTTPTLEESKTVGIAIMPIKIVNEISSFPSRCQDRLAEHGKKFLPAFRFDTKKLDRNHIERIFGLLKRQRRIATRYEKTALSFLELATIQLWVKVFANMS